LQGRQDPWCRIHGGIRVVLAILTLTHTEQEDINAHGGQMRKDLNVVIDEKKAQI
jgi:hypothetical protein